MTVQELIDVLEQKDPGAQVQLRVCEPYDDDAETLTDDAAAVDMEDGAVVIIGDSAI